MAENETIPQEPMMQEELLREEGESVVDAFVRYQKDAAREAKLALEALLPEGTRTHGKAAKRAFRKAFKVVLEELAARLEFPEDEGEQGASGPSTTGPNKVKIEVN
ncbi:MAG: hypothetical protein Kow0077_00040 [Anaerolineae bacterium]